MALHWHPVGPLPAGTYWARRAGVLGAVVLPLLLLRACGGEDVPNAARAGDPTASPSGPVASTAATPSGAASVPAAPACRDADIVATVAPAGSTSPRAFTVMVMNRGSQACRRDLGPAVVDLVVTSGADRVWARSDCGGGAAKETATLAPRTSRSVRIVWDGRRSRPGCTGTRASADPGTYRVGGKVGSKPVATVVFRER